MVIQQPMLMLHVVGKMNLLLNGFVTFMIARQLHDLRIVHQFSGNRHDFAL